MLSELQVKNLKPTDKRYSITDGEGLAVDVLPSGKKMWVLSYRIEGKQTRKTLGRYPELGCKEARAAARELKKENEGKSHNSPLLIEVITEWFNLQRPNWSSQKYADNVWYRLNYITEKYKNKPIDDVTRDDVIKATKAIVAEGTLETAVRCLRLLAKLFIFAGASGYTEKNPTVGVSEVIPAHEEENLPALPFHAMPKFWKDIFKVTAGDDQIAALKILCFTAVRVSELLRARWDSGEFDFDNDQWIVPADRMKKRKDHIVPLNPPVTAIFKELYANRIDDGFLFKNRNDITRHATSEGVLAVIKRAGYTDDMVTHGFRTVFSTAANESNLFREDVIEFQIAHVPKNKVRRVYNRAKYLPERIELMKWWADIVESWVN